METKRLNPSTCAVQSDAGDLADLRRAEGKQKRKRPKSQDNAERSAEKCEERAFGQQLANQAEAGRAERRANRNFPRARGCPGEEQIGHVGAGDQEDEGNRA